VSPAAPARKKTALQQLIPQPVPRAKHNLSWHSPTGSTQREEEAVSPPWSCGDVPEDMPTPAGASVPLFMT